MSEGKQRRVLVTCAQTLQLDGKVLQATSLELPSRGRDAYDLATTLGAAALAVLVALVSPTMSDETGNKGPRVASMSVQFEPEKGLSFEGVEIEIVRKGFHYGTGLLIGPDGRVKTTAVGGEYEVTGSTPELVQVAKQTDIQVRPKETTLVRIPAYHPRKIEVQWCYRSGEDTEWKRGESEFASGRSWRPPWDCGPLHFTISPWDGERCTIRASNAEYFQPQPAGTEFPADDAASIEFPKAEGPRARHGHPLEPGTVFAVKVGYRKNLQGMMRVSTIRSPAGE